MHEPPDVHQSGSFIDMSAVAPLLIAVCAAVGHWDRRLGSLFQSMGMYSRAELKSVLLSARYQLYAQETCEFCPAREKG